MASPLFEYLWIIPLVACIFIALYLPKDQPEQDNAVQSIPLQFRVPQEKLPQLPLPAVTRGQ